MRGLRGLLVVGLLVTSTVAWAGVPRLAEGPCRLRGVVVDEGHHTLVVTVRGWTTPLVVEGDTLDAAHALHDIAVAPGGEGPEAVLVGIVARAAGGLPIFFVQSVWIEGVGYLTDDEGVSTGEAAAAARTVLTRRRGYFDLLYGHRAGCCPRGCHSGTLAPCGCSSDGRWIPTPGSVPFP